MTPQLERTSSSPEKTLEIGKTLGRRLRGGDFLALAGPLGAGKTQLIKGIAAGLGVPDQEPVVSPTFVLIREYAGRLKLYHVDAYRLSGAAELFSLGLDEMVAEPGAVIAVEWADRTLEAVPEHACWINLDHAGHDARRLRFHWSDAQRLAEFAARLAPAC